MNEKKNVGDDHELLAERKKGPGGSFQSFGFINPRDAAKHESRGKESGTEGERERCRTEAEAEAEKEMR